MFIYSFELADLLYHNNIPFIQYFLEVRGWSMKHFYYKHVLTFLWSIQKQCIINMANIEATCVLT